MPTVSQKKCRSVLAYGLLAVVVAASAVMFAQPERVAPAESAPGVYAYEGDGFRYEYHAPTGHEGLYELHAGPKGVVDVLRSHADVAAKCRRALEEKLHVQSLDELRADYDDTIRRLTALGYL